MKVLLRDDVAGIGHRGDIVEVADGYARNFLFPNRHAMKASPSMAGQASAMRRARDMKVAESETAARTQASVLAGRTITVSARAGSTGRLFGSVGAAEIAPALAAQTGVEVERSAIGLEEPIKAVGPVEVPIHLYGDISVTVTVEVTAAG
jgi:large subunit ribosomal protein L9